MAKSGSGPRAIKSQVWLYTLTFFQARDEVLRFSISSCVPDNFSNFCCKEKPCSSENPESDSDSSKLFLTGMNEEVGAA